MNIIGAIFSYWMQCAEVEARRKREVRRRVYAMLNRWQGRS